MSSVTREESEVKDQVSTFSSKPGSKGNKGSASTASADR